MRKFERILLLKMDHIGDALWSFPTIHSLRAALPQAKIDMLCTPYLAEAFHSLSELTSVVEYDVKTSLLTRKSIIMQLRQNNYDLAIVLGPVDKINHLAFLAGARERFGYAYAGNPLRSLTSRFFLTDRFSHPADLAAQTKQPLPHEVPAMLSLLHKLGLSAMDSFPSTLLFFPLTQKQKSIARDQLRALCPGKAAFVAVHLCVKSFPYGWNKDFVGELVQQLQQLNQQVGVIITAGPAELTYLETYRNQFAAINVPIVSGLRLTEMAALLSQLSYLISWDTGVVHLATAVGTPVVDLFPAKDYEYCVQRWGPWTSKGFSLQQHEVQADDHTLDMILEAVQHLEIVPNLSTEEPSVV